MFHFILYEISGGFWNILQANRDLVYTSNEKLPPAQLVPNAEHACLWQGAFRKTELFSFLTSTSFCVTRMPTNLSTKIGNLLISSSLAVYVLKREVWILRYFVLHKLNSI